MQRFVLVTVAGLRLSNSSIVGVKEHFQVWCIQNACRRYRMGYYIMFNPEVKKWVPFSFPFNALTMMEKILEVIMS